MPSHESNDVARVEANPAVQAFALVAAVGATMVTRRLLEFAYTKATGQKPPLTRDLNSSFIRAVLWTAVTTASAAVIEVAVFRMIAARSAHEVSD